ncbi:unnamed protein product [Allacma fusca]|uniref:Uncharacterized protein n=1 Tax=Allacma fusca TaxID=39272 RepID=A0A8J2PTT2_9HEXA|nr:unnamed protein product [Allacma fusca]
MASNTLSTDVTYTVVKMEQNDPAMPAILQGNYQEMHASYCDQDNQYFRVFQTPDGFKFIYAESSLNPGTPMPYKLIPVINKHGAFHPHPQQPKITSFSQISRDIDVVNNNNNNNVYLTRNPYSIHSSGIGGKSPSMSMHAQASAQPALSSVAPSPIQFVGMKKFLLDAISEEMQRSNECQTTRIETHTQNPTTMFNFPGPHDSAYVNDVTYPPLELSEEETDAEEGFEDCEEYMESPQSVSSPQARTKIPVPITNRSPQAGVSVPNNMEASQSQSMNGTDGNGNKPENNPPELSKSEKIDQLKNKVLEYLNATKKKRLLLIPKENMLDNGSQCCPEAIQPLHRVKRCKTETVEFLTGKESIKSFVRPALLGKPSWRLQPAIVPVLLSENPQVLHLESSKNEENSNIISEDNGDDEGATAESTFCVNSDEEICKDPTPKSTPRIKIEVVHADILECLRQYHERFPFEKFSRSFALKTNSDLTKLVLQRVADDNVLEIVGKTATCLKYLDVSGSPLVTNEGIQQLLVKSAKENSSLYLMSSWVHKNLSVMNDVVMSLEHLNFSYTAANFYSRRLVNLLPGSYVFPRIFHVGENDSFGHHIFCRRPPDFAAAVKTQDNNQDFDIQLRIHVGNKGANQFIKFADNFVWRNCFVSVRDENKCKKIPVKYKRPVMMLVTAAGDEKRVCGEVIFESGFLAGLYSLLPIDLNLIGECCPNIQKITTQLIGIWRQKKPLLPNLVTVDIISEPETIFSIFLNCPSLKFVKIRVKDGTLNDEEFLKTLSSSTCSSTLKELWIVPSLLKANRVNKTCPSPSRKHSEVLQRRERVFGTPSKKPASVNELELIDGVELQVKSEQVWDNFCKLTINSVKAICTVCTELTRLGNLAWWSITTEEFQSFKDSVVKGEFHPVHVEWESLIMTDLDLSSGWDG